MVVYGCPEFTMAVCRFCLSTDNVCNDIFDSVSKLYLKIRSSLTIRVSQNDNLPKVICDTCTRNVNYIYDFYKKAKDSEAKHLQNKSLLTTKNNENKLTNEKDDEKDDELLYHTEESTENTIEYEMVKIKTEIEDKDDVLENPTEQLKEVEIKVEYESELCDPLNTEEFQPTDNNNMCFDYSTPISLAAIKRELLADQDNELLNEPSNFVQANLECNSKSTKTPKRKKSKDTPPIKRRKNSKGSETKCLDIKSTKTKNKKNDKEPQACETKKIVIRWQCLICFENKKSKHYLSQHYQDHIMAKENFKNINDPSNDQYYTLVEVKEFFDKPAFKCLQCGKMFINKELVEKHLENHEQLDALPCNSCGESFNTVDDILNHGINLHCEDKLFVCHYKICTYKTKFQGALISHQKKYSHTYKYTCDICSKGFDTLTGITDHQNLHTGAKPNACDCCEMTFMYKSQLKSHRKNAHPELFVVPPKPIFHCFECNTDFPYQKQLDRHTLYSHSGDKPFKVVCDICGKLLTSKEHLKKHLKIHAGEKNFKCRTCKKAFIDRWHREMHERVHTGVKPFSCSHCPKAFAQKGTLLVHERSHSAVRPFKCEMCNKGFYTKGLLTVHQISCTHSALSN